MGSTLQREKALGGRQHARWRNSGSLQAQLFPNLCSPTGNPVTALSLDLSPLLHDTLDSSKATKYWVLPLSLGA